MAEKLRVGPYSYLIFEAIAYIFNPTLLLGKIGFITLKPGQFDKLIWVGYINGHILANIDIFELCM